MDSGYRPGGVFMPAQTFDTVPHVVMTAHGALPGGESWSCSLRTTKVDAGVPQATLQAVANAVTANWETFVHGGPYGLCSACTLSGVTLRSLDARGITTTLAEGVAAVPAFQGASQTVPDQIAVVVTLLTARAGRTGKGRIYLPILTANIEAGGVMQASQITALGTGLKTLFDGINTSIVALDATARVAVQSKTASSNIGEGYTGAAVVNISIGNVMDTQRRRRASLTETYTTRALA